MEALFRYSEEQYDFVREARTVLFGFCKTMSSGDFITENSLFGNGGSIRNLFVHVVNTYAFWIAKCGLNKNIVFTEHNSIEDISDIIGLFDTVDIYMFEFMEFFKNPARTKIHFEIRGIKISAQPFKLFTHVVTHEFHHKGQILSLSRHFGYIPVDTDIMR